ncbi:MAG: sugar transferase [Bacteroidia bacterium]|nr:sugar transferase [Bacteroidia bacterium]
MLREQEGPILVAHKVLDICLTAAAFIAAYFIKRDLLPSSFRGLTMAPNYYIILFVIVIIWYIAFNSFNTYASYRRRTFREIFWSMVKAVSTAMVFLLLFMYIFKISDVSRIMLGIFFMMNIGLLAGSKCVVYTSLQRYRKKGLNVRNVLIVGSRDRSKDVIDAIEKYSGAGFRVLGCVETDSALVGTSIKNHIQVIGTTDEIEGMLKGEIVDELVFAIPLNEIKGAENIIAMALEIGVSIRIIPDWQVNHLLQGSSAATMSIENFLGIASVSLRVTSPSNAGLLVKDVFDFAFSGIVLVICLPLFLVIFCAIKIISPGPVFFKQERSSLNGRLFTLYKFRTMIPGAEKQLEDLRALNEADGPVFKIKRDPRVIPFVGPLLRKTSLDELPQLINVLRGEMSLVGPRPPIPDEVENYKWWQRRRLSMKPGLTCIWQCTSNRNDIDFAEWMKMDLAYIDSWSLWLDFKIILRTIKVVLVGQGR